MLPKLRIEVIGRAKSSIKLATGKWVFPESLEIVYRKRSEAEASSDQP